MKRAIGFAVVLVLTGGAAAGWLAEGEEVVVTDPVVFSESSPFRYPIGLWDRKVEGETLLMVHVTPAGRVDSAYVLASSGEAAFDSAAVEGAHALRFAPARRGGDRIASWVRLPVRFRMPADPTGEAADPTGEGEGHR